MTPTPGSLREFYRAFLRDDRVLLTGHSHQAWPDVARAGLLEAFDDAALCVDDKWERALAVASTLREFIAQTVGTRASCVALAQNTHELVVRFLSSLDWKTRRHLVTTSGEFHTIRRQLERLQEEGVEVTFVEAEPVSTLAQRMADCLRDDTAAVLVSTVLFATSSIVPGLNELTLAARRRGVHVLLDAYHAFNVVPFTLEALDAMDAFVVAGGYKYAQWGEGCCFMCVPNDCSLRPVYTGWFAAFGELSHARGVATQNVVYDRAGAWRFAGSTYDPSSHYRARAVTSFFQEQELTVSTLREISIRQTSLLIDRLGDVPIATPRDARARGGFVSVRVPDGARMVAALRSQGVWVDARGDLVRLGPAPYTTDDELDRAAALVRAESGASTKAGALQR